MNPEMKKFLATLTVLLFLAVPVSAEESVKRLERVENRIENRLENLQERRLEFKQRLEAVRDEKKKQILEHLSNQLKLINSRATKAMLNHLERLQSLLNKIKERVPAVDITAAQAKIDEAKTAVTAQAEKEYIIEFTDESGLRAGASSAKQNLRADLKTVRELVRAARQAVVDVLKTAKSL